MRDCPHCQKTKISEWKLVLQSVGVPAVVAECESCHAVVFIRSSDNPLIYIGLEFAFYFMALFLAIWSANFFGVMWPGVVLAIVLFFVRLYVKSKERLDYLR